MRKRKLLFFCLAVGLLLTVVVWVVFRDREPTYDGRTLSEWVSLQVGRENDASNAIRHMGTNTFPVILRWLRSEPALWKAKMLQDLSLGPAWIRPHFLVSWLAEDEVRVRRAYQALGILQEEAALLGPDFLSLSHAKSDIVATRGLEALGWMGTTGLPHLLLALRDPHHPNRKQAIREVGRVLYLHRDAVATEAIQRLIECTADADSAIRGQASLTLAEWASLQPPRAAIDDFKRSVGSTNAVFLRWLEQFERSANKGITNNSPTP